MSHIDYTKKSVAELTDILTQAGVDISEGSKKADLVALCERNLTADAPETPADEEAAEAPAPKASKKTDPEEVTLKSLEKSVSGRYEVVGVTPDAPEGDRFYRLFGPEGQKCSPVLPANQQGELSKLQSRQNSHVQRNVGNKAYEAIVDRARRLGYEG